MRMTVFDEATRTSVRVPVPGSWRVTCHEDDMDAPCSCARCGRPISFGESCTGRTRLTESGVWGLAVCGQCCREEALEAMQAARAREEER